MTRSTVLILASALCLAATPPIREGVVEVALKDGSTRTARPDAATDVSRLRLRFGDSDCFAIVALDWNEVASIRDGERRWLPAEFESFRREIESRPRVTELVDLARDAAIDEFDEFATAIADRPDCGGEFAVFPSPARRSRNEPPAAARVSFIEVDARAANWDNDPEWDGIALRLWPTNAAGDTVRADGTLDVTLFVADFSESTRHSGDDNHRIGHWVERVRASDGGPNGVVVRLPFQNFDPDRAQALWHPDSRIPAHAEVSVSFAVPGSGVLRASAGPVRIRRFSSSRDRLFERSGTRYFPHE